MDGCELSGGKVSISMVPSTSSIETAMPPDMAFALLCSVVVELSHGKKGWRGLAFSGGLDAFGKRGEWWITSQDRDNRVLELLWKQWLTGYVHIKVSVSKLDDGNSLINFDSRAMSLFGLSGKSDVPIDFLKQALKGKLKTQ